MSTSAADTAAPVASGTAGFVHLHVHTEFSKQDGLARIKDAAKAAAADGQGALAMTDHGNMAGAWKFVKACKDAGIKPILGVEAYMALVPDQPWEPVDEADAAAAAAGLPLAMRPGVRFQRTTQMGMDAESGKEKRNTNNHLTILARNETGWRNLCAIMNKAENSFFHKALIDYALLKEHGEGLIVLSGCLGGPVASHVASAGRALREVDVEWLRARVAHEARQAYLADRAPVDGTETDPAILAEAESIATNAMQRIQTPTAEDVAAAHALYETKVAQARQNLAYLIDCVGAENVYVEIMEHGLEAEGKEHIKALAGLASEAGVRVVATNDSHYVGACDCDAHDSWLVNGENARGNRVSKDDPNRWRFNGSGYWMRTEAEMRGLYPNARTWQAACDETVRLAERIEDNVIPFTGLRLPRFPVPADVLADWQAGAETVFTDHNNAEHPARQVGSRAYRSASALYLHRLTLAGMKDRYETLDAEKKQRAGFEFDVITGMGLEDYFLIVWDVLDWARSDRGMATDEHPRGVPGGKKPILVGPGRGSAAGSLISYALRIVMVDPLANGLLFERFLDVARIGMPDIDVDFEAARRDEVYEYLISRYGAEFIARIGAFQVAKTKRAIKDAARVLDAVSLGERLAKAVPVHQGSPQGFARIFEEEIDKDTGRPRPNPEASEFRDLATSNPAAMEIVSLARKFENVVAGEGIHAAGVIISDEPLTDLIPMRRQRDKQGNLTGVPIALWDGKDIDDFGMLKLDALSLRNLDIVAAAAEHIVETTGETVDPDALPHPGDLGNPRVARAFQILRDGRTSGIFQLESSGITELCEQIAPTSFDDLSALVALYRPGPMGAKMHTLYADRKNGRVGVDYGIFTADPVEQDVIKSVLDDTFGVIAYQEQMMVLAEVVAGFDADRKNRLRKAFSKKDRPAMEALKEVFLTQGRQQMTLADGTEKIAFSPATLESLWVTFDASAEYLFNRSHSAAYGYLAYGTAYFKSNWPTQYGAGILGVTDKADKRLPALFALNQDGIAVLPPDVNRSKAKTAPDPEDPNAVRLGLGEIRDVGSNGRWIEHERTLNGPFASLRDLVARVKIPGEDGSLTAKMPVTVTEGLIEAGAFDGLGLPRLGLMIAVRAINPGTDGEVEIKVPDAEWSPLERSARQRHRLGVALGDHPMHAYKQTLLEYQFNPREDRFGNIFGGRPSPLHRVEQMPRGNMLTVGVLTSWAEKTTKKGGKLANFTLEGSRASMSGTVFNDTIAAMRHEGTTPEVGDIVAVAGAVKTRTITNTTIDVETSEEIEETREVRELIGSFLDTVQVDTSASVDLDEVTDDERVDLARVIPFAKVRVGAIAAEKRANQVATRRAKAAERAAAKKAAKDAEQETVPDADDQQDTADTTADTALAAPVGTLASEADIAPATTATETHDDASDALDGHLNDDSGDEFCDEFGSATAPMLPVSAPSGLTLSGTAEAHYGSDVDQDGRSVASEGSEDRDHSGDWAGMVFCKNGMGIQDVRLGAPGYDEEAEVRAEFAAELRNGRPPLVDEADNMIFRVSSAEGRTLLIVAARDRATAEDVIPRVGLNHPAWDLCEDDKASGTTWRQIPIGAVMGTNSLGVARVSAEVSAEVDSEIAEVADLLASTPGGTSLADAA